jgi:hypothetical protein
MLTEVLGILACEELIERPGIEAETPGACGNHGLWVNPMLLRNVLHRSEAVYAALMYETHDSKNMLKPSLKVRWHSSPP